MSFFHNTALNSDRPRTADGTTLSKPKRPGTSRNVSFTTEPRPKESFRREESYRRDATRSPSPPLLQQREGNSNWLRINHHEQNMDPNLMPISSSIANPIQTPFLVLSDDFADCIDSNPRLDLLTTDNRAPYFYSGGAYIPRLSTLYLTSNLIYDADPAAISSSNRRTEITKIEFYSSRDFSRDKIRCPERSYMAAGVAAFPTPSESPGIVVCAQGSLKEPAGLVYIDTKRPHKSHMILNNYQGRPFNSPFEIVSSPIEGCLYFIDPHYGFEQGFRPKPQLPSGQIYRFDPESGDIRVVANGHNRPAGLALSPDGRTLYVSEMADKYGGTNIYAYTISSIESSGVENRGRQNPLGPSFHISVQTPGGTTNGNITHKSTPSNSSNSAGSYNSSANTSSNSSGAHPPGTAVSNSSSGISRPEMPSTANSFNRTTPLSPKITPLDNSKSFSSSSPPSAAPGNRAESRPGSRSRSTQRPLHAFSRANSSFNHNDSSIGANVPAPRSPLLLPSHLRNHSASNANASVHPTTPTSYFPPSHRQSSTFLTQKRLFAYHISPVSSSSSSSSISTASLTHHPRQPHLYLSTSTGVSIFSTSTPDTVGSGGGNGNLIGKILIDPEEGLPIESEDERVKRERTGTRRKYLMGVAKVAFGEVGECWLLGGERIWRVIGMET